MSKAIVIIDMPEICLECPFRYKSEEMALGNFTYQSLFRCKFEPEGLSEDEGDMVYLNDIMMQGKPDWCPLREVPQKKPALEADKYYYALGYNTCIYDILKGSEGNALD